jgi:catechol 2,3-dioxygenase-like lactoylglutathione lyase family enzyme/ketosteroid isomerase-like protein
MAHLELVAMIVREYDPAIEFFVNVLGFDLVEDAPALTTDGRAKRWVVVRPPRAQTGILLARADSEEQSSAVGAQFAGRVGLFLRVDDFDATYARLTAAGVEFVRPPRSEPYGRVAVFRDLEGNRWDLLGPLPGSPSITFPPTLSNMTEHDDVSRTIIDMEERALDRWGKGDPSGFLEISADDVVYFDPFQERRLNGIAELRELYELIRGRVQIAHFELIDPRVQHAGDMAVLTFNYVAQDTNEGTSRWNCTEVFRRDGGTWRIIQTHWSFTKPALRDPVVL